MNKTEHIRTLDLLENIQNKETNQYIFNKAFYTISKVSFLNNLYKSSFCTLCQKFNTNINAE